MQKAAKMRAKTALLHEISAHLIAREAGYFGAMSFRFATRAPIRKDLRGSPSRSDALPTVFSPQLNERDATAVDRDPKENLIDSFGPAKGSRIQSKIQ